MKCIYYPTKESILQAAHNKSHLTFQGYNDQIFAAIAPSTIAKQRVLKSALQILKCHHIPFRWGYPFCLILKYHNLTYISATYDEAQHHLNSLHPTPVSLWIPRFKTPHLLCILA